MGNMRFNCRGRGKARIKLTGCLVVVVVVVVVVDVVAVPGIDGTSGAAKSCKVICNDPGGLPFPKGSAFLTLPSGIHWMVAVSVTVPACG